MCDHSPTSHPQASFSFCSIRPRTYPHPPFHYPSHSGLSQSSKRLLSLSSWSGSLIHASYLILSLHVTSRHVTAPLLSLPLSLPQPLILSARASILGSWSGVLFLPILIRLLSIISQSLIVSPHLGAHVNPVTTPLQYCAGFASSSRLLGFFYVTAAVSVFFFLFFKLVLFSFLLAIV